MRAKEFIAEGKLTPGEMFGKHLNWRPNALLKKLEAGTPFVDSLGQNPTQYFPTAGEYARLKPIIDQAVADRTEDPNAKVPSITINIEKIVANGKETPGPGPIPLSKFEKADLQTVNGQASSTVNVQPLGIDIAADKVEKDVSSADEIKQALANNKAIRGGDLHNIISQNKVLAQAGELGEAVKIAADNIASGQIPNLKDYDEKTQKTVAIDAGEYLGIMQLVHETANFPKRNQFLDFLETGSLEDMLIIFPGSQNSQLQDSYGVQNTATGHSIMISSKGGKGSTAAGAAPALSGLKIPQNMIKKRKPGNGVDFILMMQDLAVVLQPFAGMNFLNRFYPESVPEIYKSVLPFTQEDMKAIQANINGRGQLDPKYSAILKTRKSKASRAGGILFYCVAKDLVETFNANQPIPDFRQTVLTILDMNFVQIFSRIVGKKLTADILWPGKVDGNVLLWTKAEASSPSSAGLSFKVMD